MRTIKCITPVIAGAAIAVTAVLGLPIVEASAESKVKVLRSWPKTLEAIRILDHFHEAVEARGGGDLKLAQSGPEVVPPLEQLNPVSAGVFDMLFSHGAYHAGTNGLLMGVDALKVDPVKLRESGLYDFISKNYEKKHGLKLISLAATGGNGYHLVLKKPPHPVDGLKGRKIRGTATYHPLIKNLGGSPVVLTFGQMYTALEKGVVDGYAFPLYGLRTFKFYEAGAKYVMRPAMGVSKTFTLVNVNAFNKLSKKHQTAIIEAGKETEIWSIKWFDDYIAQEEKDLRAKGVEYVDYPEKFRPHIRKWFNEGVLSLVEKYSKADGVEFVKMARSKGMVAE